MPRKKVVPFEPFVGEKMPSAETQIAFHTAFSEAPQTHQRTITKLLNWIADIGFYRYFFAFWRAYRKTMRTGDVDFS